MGCKWRNENSGLDIVQLQMMGQIQKYVWLIVAFLCVQLHRFPESTALASLSCPQQILYSFGSFFHDIFNEMCFESFSPLPLWFSSCRTSNRKSLIGSGQSSGLPRPHSPLSSLTGKCAYGSCARLRVCVCAHCFSAAVLVHRGRAINSVFSYRNSVHCVWKMQQQMSVSVFVALNHCQT